MDGKNKLVVAVCAVQLPVRSLQATKLQGNQNLRFCNPDTNNFKNMNLNTVPKMGAWRSHFWDYMRSRVKEQKKALLRFHFWDRLAVPKMRPQKSQNPQQRPTHATNKKIQLLFLSNQHIELEQRRPAHAKPDFT